MSRRNVLWHSKPRSGATRATVVAVILLTLAGVGMIFPVVQQAREQSRRAQCLNNLKILGLAFHNHHDQLRRLPPGGACDQKGLSLGSHETGKPPGSSWMIYLLPLIEKPVLVEKYRFDGESGINEQNLSLFDKQTQTLACYLCPSSPLPMFAAVKSVRQDDGDVSANSRTWKIMAGSYAGISGAAWTGESPFVLQGQGSNDVFYADDRWVEGSYGFIAWNGSLYPNSNLNFLDLKDGLSNVMIVAEESTWMMSENGKADWRTQGETGFHYGAEVAEDMDRRLEYVGRTAGLLTIRNLVGSGPKAGGGMNAIYGPKKRGWRDAAADGPGRFGANNPIRSAHPGGACILIADGSSRFVPETVALEILMRMAIRDDVQDYELP